MQSSLATWHSHNSVEMFRVKKQICSRVSRTRGLSFRVQGKKKNAESKNVVPEELLIAKKALQKALQKVEQAIALGDPSKTILSQTELFQNMIKQQSEFLERERAIWEQERTNWKKEETELKQKIEDLLTLIQQKNTVQTPQISEPQKAPPVETKIHTEASASVQDSILTAMAAIDTEDVLSPSFNPISANGAPAVSAVEVEGPVEVMKSPPSGPPPTLSVGDDDIYWVSQVHEALSLKGFHCGDEDIEDFYFGDGTASALLTYQACNGLEETGVTNEATWTALLGPELKPVVGSLNSNSEAKQKPKEEAKKEDEVPKEFPVLSEMDGGKNVHYFQVMLEIAGYSCGKDDMEWWHFGDDTIAATKTFQACNDLPESGVADVSTWKKLAGENKTIGDVIQRVKQENIFEDDMTNCDRVWLLGEQRWERKV